LALLRVIAVAIGQKGAEIWAKETDLQPVHCKSGRLLGQLLYMEFVTNKYLPEQSDIIP
jgi:hypothetical protein